MLEDLNAVAFERGNPARMIGQQTYAAKIEIEQDLSPDSNFALYAPAVLRAAEIVLFMVELKFIGAANVLERKPE